MSIREFLETFEKRLEAFRQRAEDKYIRSLRDRGIAEEEIVAAVEIGREIWNENLPDRVQEAIDFVTECRESALTPSGKPN